MKNFLYINAKTIDDAAASLAKANSLAFAGGTDLLGVLKDQILPVYPETLVNLKTIPNLDYINEDTGGLKIGALASVYDISINPTVISKYSALSQAAQKVSGRALRDMGTIGGNICQYVRCWYFRGQGNYFNCLRKSAGSSCFALVGDNRYHSIFGAVNGCVAVNPGDLAPALVALNASFVTNKRTIPAEQFWSMVVPGSTVLNQGEIVTEIQVPAPAQGVKSAFIKFGLRRAMDFAIVNCAAAIGAGDARICLNAVFNKPYRATAAETAVKGKTIDDAVAAAAGAAAVTGAVALPYNKYKIQIASTLVKRTVLACA